MQTLRTPDERFANLPDYPFEPHYMQIPDGEGGTLRVHYVDEGPSDAEPVLLLHGEPSWSFLYRKMIPIIARAGFRVIAPDLVGFGRSDKPTEMSDYSFQRLVDWTASVMNQLDLQQINLFGQDWGGLIGLRLAAENEARFARLIMGNTGLPTGDHKMPEAFLKWQTFTQRVKKLPVRRILQNSCVSTLSRDVLAGYEAPFPDGSYQAGARILPSLVPTSPDDPATAANRRAWQVLMRWQKPVLLTFSDSDPITAGGDRVFLKLVPGTKGQPHTTIKDAGHFLQEDKGEELAHVMVNFIQNS